MLDSQIARTGVLSKVYKNIDHIGYPDFDILDTDPYLGYNNEKMTIS
ncbi:hypothetical protein [Xenorhabdus miraniensis]|nr:hypothetical protein [Xenorhabdus miraniensis]